MKARLSFTPEIEKFPGKILERLLSAKMRKIRKKKNRILRCASYEGTEVN